MMLESHTRRGINRLRMELLEQRLVLAAPGCNFDAINQGYFAAGWAYDPDSPNQSITVEFRIDGNVVDSMVTDGHRSDVNQAFGITGNQGFSWEIADQYLDGARHTLRVWAIDQQNGNDFQVANSPKTFQNALSSPRQAIPARNPGCLNG